MSNIMICDLCGTIVSENTTIGFVQYLAQKRKISFKNPPFFLRVIGKILFYFKFDLMKRYYVSFLEGFTENEINCWAKEYVAEQSLNPRVIDLMFERRNRGYKLILCSGSIEPVVKAFAELLNFDFYHSSTLRFNNNIVVGISEDILFFKDKVLRHYFKGGESCIVTDNSTDLNLVKECSEIFVVIKNSKEESFWKRNLTNLKFTIINFKN